MIATKEITGNITNIKYYAGKIQESAKGQLNLDWQLGEKVEQIGKFSMPGSKRFDSLTCVIAACDWIISYCANMEVNLQTAEGQDIIFKPEYYK